MDQSNPPLDDDDMQYDPPTRTPKYGAGRKKSKKWLLFVGLAFILLVAVGTAAYLLFFKENTPAPAKTETVQTPGQSVTDLNEPQADATDKTFKSETMNIEFTYRSDWTLKESSDKQQVTLTSPRVAYTTKDGQASEGVFTVKLRHGIVPDAVQQAVQKSVAVRDSQVIAYTQPTSEQRQYTNLSYGGIDAQTFGYFMVTGSIEYKTGQTFGSQVNLLGNAYLFVGGYGADSGDTLSFDPVPAASYDTSAYQQAQKIIESLKIY